MNYKVLLSSLFLGTLMISSVFASSIPIGVAQTVTPQQTYSKVIDISGEDVHYKLFRLYNELHPNTPMTDIGQLRGNTLVFENIIFSIPLPASENGVGYVYDYIKLDGDMNWGKYFTQNTQIIFRNCTFTCPDFTEDEFGSGQFVIGSKMHNILIEDCDFIDRGIKILGDGTWGDWNYPQNITIKDCRIGGFSGMYAETLYGIRWINNTFYRDQSGISTMDQYIQAMGDSSQLTIYGNHPNLIIANNTFIDGLNGIFFWNTFELTYTLPVVPYTKYTARIENNTFIRCGLNWHVEFDNPFELDKSNKVNDKYIYSYSSQSGLDADDFVDAGIIYLFNCSDSVIEDLQINYVRTPITLRFSHNITIQNCQLTQFHGAGILLISSWNNTIRDNYIAGWSNVPDDYNLNLYFKPAGIVFMIRWIVDSKWVAHFPSSSFQKHWTAVNTSQEWIDEVPFESVRKDGINLTAPLIENENCFIIIRSKWNVIEDNRVFGLYFGYFNQKIGFAVGGAGTNWGKTLISDENTFNRNHFDGDYYSSIEDWRDQYEPTVYGENMWGTEGDANKFSNDPTTKQTFDPRNPFQGVNVLSFTKTTISVIATDFDGDGNVTVFEIREQPIFGIKATESAIYLEFEYLYRWLSFKVVVTLGVIALISILGLISVFVAKRIMTKKKCDPKLQTYSILKKSCVSKPLKKTKLEKKR